MYRLICRYYLATITVLLVFAITIYRYCFAFSNGDVRDFLLPWYQFIIYHGRWHAMGLEFSNYTPPYLYLLAMLTNFDSILTRIQIIKMTSVLGTIFLCSSSYYVFCYFYSRRPSAVAAMSILLLPTVALNAAVWGQCDAFYTAALVLALGFLLRDKWALAMAAIGLALSLKLQAIFIGPAVGAFVFRRNIRLWMLPIPIVCYYILMVPAVLAGRTFKSVSLVYFGQFETFKWLSAGAPNLWTLLQKILSKVGLPEIGYTDGVNAGMILAGLMSLVLVFIANQGRMTKQRILLIFLVSVISSPYFLPKMHDRYFFSADIIAFICAVCFRSPLFSLIAVCVEVGSFLACLGTPFGYYSGAPYGAAFMTFGLLFVWLAFVLGAFPRLQTRWSPIAWFALPLQPRLTD
jgi:Gpi18-like mannosyltransferase